MEILHPYRQITSITVKYSLEQLAAVCKRDYLLARNLGVSLEDYLTLIR